MAKLKFSQLFSIVTVFLLAYFTGYLMLLGSGFFTTFDFFATLLLSFFILLLNSSTKRFYLILLPLVILYGFYTPIGLTFGSPSYQYVASVFATDLQESKEFFAQVPLKNLLICITIFASLFLGRFISRKYQINFHRNKTFVATSLFLLFLTSPPALFIRESFDSIHTVYSELKRLNSLSVDSEWGKSSLTANSRYDDYILVIGESARKDYHHAYGYPIENTPFMSKAKGTLIDGLTAGGTNTIASLKLMLTKPNSEKWEGNYSLGLVDLIKSANIKTYWLSNQGYLGTFDTPISSLANKSDEKIFLKSGDSFNQNISDFALLPKFKAILEKEHQGKRFIVVHLYGSHPISCDRLTDYPKIFSDEMIDKRYANVNCYISTIKKTDHLLEKLYQTLNDNAEKNKRSFSMIYFADHGLAHHITEKSIDIHNSSGKSKLHFDIPLFKISSDDTERKSYKAFKSGLNFTDGIANWIGITNAKVNPDIDLFSPVSDKSDYGLKKMIEKFEGNVDPAIVIPTQ